ncbi:OsmC family protein [Candidatus Lokiarchaeum ossiferum]|uniref:OsmC family protein n=1 Tax=Candidatus Lokiarchaeum ossiferum TaxID=2951803 RepID=UPI00352C8B42
MNFKIAFKQTGADKKSTNNFHRTNTMSVSEEIPPITVQLPIAYNGPANSQNREMHYTPEDLYLGALAGCFFTTFSVVSKNSNFVYEALDIQATGIMEEVEGVKMMSQVSLTVTLSISPEISDKLAFKILQIAEQRCPLANSVKTKIETKFILAHS